MELDNYLPYFVQAQINQSIILLAMALISGLLSTRRLTPSSAKSTGTITLGFLLNLMRSASIWPALILMYQNVWEGHCVKASDAQVLRGKYEIEHFTPGNNWDGPYYGADWGFSVDPSTLVRCWIFERKLYVEYEAWGIGVDIDALPSMFDEVPRSRDFTIRADSARPETISYMTKRGFRIVSAHKGKGSVEDGIAHLRGYEKIIIHPRCKHAAEEAHLWRYKTDKLTGDVLPTLQPGNEHCWDAIRYALEPLIGGKRTGGSDAIKAALKTSRWAG